MYFQCTLVLRVIMKILITLFVLFFSSSIFADVYYCVEEESTGFIPSENFREANYKINKYTIKINSEKLTIASDEIGMPEGYSTCRKYYYHENVLECNGPLGGRDFTLNLNTLIFTYTNTYLTDEMNDGLSLSWGKCQKL